MNERLDEIKKATEPFRQKIIHHKVYSAINTIEDLKVFMQYHIYAVWDFMSLLKTLQNNFTCTSVPWFPKGYADTGYLINEIVVGEESDIDSFGNRKSHFELYLDAMRQCGADTSPIERFIESLRRTKDRELAFQAADTPQRARDFVDFTFKLIESSKGYLQSVVFTFGREDLIPRMFLSIVNNISKNFPDSVAIFKYYLERHIEVDGGHHSHLALEMTSNLCGSNDQFWEESKLVAIESLEKRINLWDAAYESILASQQKNESKKG